MRVLALEPYYGGSHRAFLEGWSQRSQHDWTILQLPANKWKWRMRHGAITFAKDVNARVRDGESWDIVFCSDMLNLAEFKGLVDKSVAGLRSVAYFHENQLTYPVRNESERDYHFAMTNFTTCLAADAVWFNSEFHRNEFLTALPEFLRRMPDNQSLEAYELIRPKSRVMPQGIDGFPKRGPRPEGPIRILWAARWEHDKNPGDFVAALKILKESGHDFRLNVIGEQFEDSPKVFEWAKEYFADHIDRWGYLDTRAEYVAALCESDIVVSTANHEFFGVSVVEAIAAGCYPLLPRRLAYPEILGVEGDAESLAFYDGSVAELAARLAHHCTTATDGSSAWLESNRQKLSVFQWHSLSPRLDAALADLEPATR